jgi:hypothetical protein
MRSCDGKTHGHSFSHRDGKTESDDTSALFTSFAFTCDSSPMPRFCTSALAFAVCDVSCVWTCVVTDAGATGWAKTTLLQTSKVTSSGETFFMGAPVWFVRRRELDDSPQRF